MHIPSTNVISPEKKITPGEAKEESFKFEKAQSDHDLPHANEDS